MRNKIIDQIKKAGVLLSMAAVFSLSVPQTNVAATNAYIDVRSANVRQKPVDGENITSLPQGTHVIVQETQQGSDGKSWSKVQFTNQGKQIMGWVRSDLIVDAEDADTQEEQDDQPVNAVTLEETAQVDKPQGAETESDDATQGTSEEGDVTDADAAEDGTITNGTLSLKINEAFNADEIPVDFSQGEVTFKGSKYQGVTYNNGELSALYLVDQQTQIGSFYICDQKTDEIYPFVRVTYGDGYLIFMQNTDVSELPTGSTETIIPLENGTQLQAFWHLGNADASDFYEVYAMNESGECGWYSYDNVDKTCQRLNIQDNSEQMNNLNKAYNKLKEKSETQRKSDHKIMAGMLLACVILFFILINVLLKRPTKKKEAVKPFKEKKPQKENQPKKMSESANKAVAEAVVSAVHSIQGESLETVETETEPDEQIRDHYMEVLEKVSKTAEKQPQAGFAAQAEEMLQKQEQKKMPPKKKTKKEEQPKNTNAKEAAERAEKVVKEQRDDMEKAEKDDLEIMDLNDL